MAYRPPIAVYDACVLYPFHLRNILVQCAVDGLVEARWSEAIHTEWIRNLVAQNPNLTVERLEATRDLMRRVLPEADVTGYEYLIPNLQLPDPDDRHVLAAAIACKASAIVSWNLKDFPRSQLARYGIVCLQPDDFLIEVHDSEPEALMASIANARRHLRKSVPGIDDFITEIKRQGLTKIAGVLRRRKVDLA